MSKEFYKRCDSHDETLNVLNSITARSKFSKWTIESFRKDELLPVIRIIIIREKELQKASIDWRYNLTLIFLYTNNQYYEFIYKDIYLKKLLRDNFQIINTRIHQAYFESEI